MDIRTQSSLLAALISTALAIAMLLRPQRARVLTLYGIFAGSVGAYYLARFVDGLVGAPDGSMTGRVLLGVTIVLGSVVPSTALSFFLEFLNYSPRTARKGRKASLLSILLGLAVGATPLCELFWARAAVTAWVLLALTFSCSLLIARMSSTESRVERLRLTYLATGAALALVAASLDFLPALGLQVPVLGPIVCTLYLFLLSQTLLRLRLMDLHELLGKILSQALLAALLALVFFVMTSWVVITDWVSQSARLFLFNTVVAALVVQILVDPVGEKVDHWVVALIFRQRFAFLESVRSLHRRAANVIDVPELAATVLDGLNETRRVTHASIYLLAEDRPGFRLLDCRGPQPALFIDAGSARALVARNERAQLFETVERRISELRGQALEARRLRDELRRLTEIKTTMLQMKAGISVPLIGAERLLGFLNLWDERVPEAFASDEIAQILGLAEHIATVVENSKLYERMRERDRLAALGEMAAGLAHEIRNPLGAIKGAAQCLEPAAMRADDREFVEVIVEEVNRLNGVVTAFLDYARPLKQSFGPTDLNEVIVRTVRLLQNDVPKHITLRQELAPELPRVDGDSEQLRQVLFNLVQNAVQAMGDREGRIIVRTQRSDRQGEFRAPDTVELSVSDDGPGIPQEQQVNIFVPFFTTKEKGTGLGLAICQRIVKSHGGSISVQSRVGEGSQFLVRLPASALEAAPPVPDGGPQPEPEAARALSSGAPGTEGGARPDAPAAAPAPAGAAPPSSEPQKLSPGAGPQGEGEPAATERRPSRSERRRRRAS